MISIFMKITKRDLDRDLSITRSLTLMHWCISIQLKNGEKFDCTFRKPQSFITACPLEEDLGRVQNFIQGVHAFKKEVHN